MLCLTRKPNQKIIATTPAGERIEITVIAIRGGCVRIGVEASQSVSVNRLEVEERKERAA